ncbi:MAG: hypothetical protein LBR74_10315, partial [Eubacterium sp.]|nr:hypothetical protein [Eubacterium sp.]
MKRTKKVLSMALALITALLLIPAIPVYADSEYDLSQTINEANGDGRTPFNPQWVDGANGIVSFDVQNPELYSDMVYLVYRVRVYLDKNYIGEEEIGTKVGSSTATVDISEYMDGDGEYEFVVYFYDGMNSPKNIAKSATYVRGAPRPSAVTGSSTSQPLSLPVRAANTISFSRAIKADNTLWNWASGTPKNIMDNVKAISIYPDSAAIIKTDGSGWYDDGDQEYVKVTDNAAFISQGESFSFIDGNGGLWLELDSALTHVADNVVDAA